MDGLWIVEEEVIEAIESQFGKGTVRQMYRDQIWLHAKPGQNFTSTQVARWLEKKFLWLIRAYAKAELARLQNQ